MNNPMPTHKEVHIELRGAVGIVTFDRPEHNYFNFDLLVALADAFEYLDAQPEIRATVLASKGRVFCAGGNFNDGNVDVSDRSLSERIYAVAMRLFRVKKPMIAAIQGAAIGGGLGLALVADFRIGAPQARFSANFAKLGIHAGFGMTATLPRLIGPQKASLLLYTGRRIKAEEGLALGLIDALAGPAGALEDAIALATEIAQCAPLAVGSMRNALRGPSVEEVHDAMQREAKEQQWQFQTADFKEGLAAITEGRQANFRGI